ncbi:MAG: hypothetical protein AAF821_16290 [Cyanobacteria bacterium P01_D01_bin.156]
MDTNDIGCSQITKGYSLTQIMALNFSVIRVFKAVIANQLTKSPTTEIIKNF